MCREAKVQMRAEAILKHLYEHIEEARDLSVDEEGSELDQAVDDALMMMHVAASFAAHVIRETSEHNIDINVVYEDYLFLLDKFLDEE